MHPYVPTQLCSGFEALTVDGFCVYFSDERGKVVRNGYTYAFRHSYVRSDSHPCRLLMCFVVPGLERHVVRNGDAAMFRHSFVPTFKPCIVDVFACIWAREEQ